MPSGFDGQRARAFVKGSGDGQDHLLLFEGRFWKTVLPGSADMREIARTGHHRRDLGDLLFGAPRQNRRQAIDRGVRQPALGAGDQPPGNLRPEIERQAAGDQRRVAFLGHPWQLQITRADLPGGRMKTHRRQQRPCSHLARTDQLLDFKQLDLSPAGRAVSDNRIAGSQIDSDDVWFFHGL
ncbi:MAG: hypothetical protein CAPSK01_004592 [Candidatus Accumulibacter vicinus]|uniref:Uncharacterized protein n=1 Tax=Candidatus Accumulibacter vicinus TaxID=2954382 RepID=A0A084XUF3_9PROT|nr:MAG: hypothetical protein CAPSK01_004592 [Candidatus Accumulibacter vicinus]